MPPYGPTGDFVPLPDGKKVYRPKIDWLAPAMFDDWVAHSTQVAAPRDLTAKRPIEWIAQSDWDALSWREFRKRFPKSTCVIGLSDVGFSPSHDQAILHATHELEGCGTGRWLLVGREENRWAVVKRKRTFIACGPVPNITDTNR